MVKDERISELSGSDANILLIMFKLLKKIFDVSRNDNAGRVDIVLQITIGTFKTTAASKINNMVPAINGFWGTGAAFIKVITFFYDTEFLETMIIILNC